MNIGALQLFAFILFCVLNALGYPRAGGTVLVLTVFVTIGYAWWEAADRFQNYHRPRD